MIPFLHPIIFWTGLAAVSLPIMIHLLNRRRFKVRDWAAMQFLLDSIRKNRRRLRIEEMILLAVRCLAVLLLAMAIGRFTGCQAMDELTGQMVATSQQNVVFVLDDTVSMGQQLGAGTLFQEAQAEISRQIDGLRSGDKICCLLVSRDEKRMLEILSDKDSLKAQLATLSCSDGRGRIEESLARARQLLADTVGEKKVVILSDFRVVDLAAPDRQAALRTAYENLRKDHVEIVAMDYGRNAQVNLSVRQVELADKLVLAGERVRAAVTIHNYGARDARDVEVGLSLSSMSGGAMIERTLDTLKVDEIKAGDFRRAEFGVTVPEAGPALVTVRLPHADVDGRIDELRGDDQAVLALDARAILRVLIVDGLPAPTEARITDGESYLLSRVLDPNQDGGHGVRAEVVPIDYIKDQHFDEFDLVVVMNVASLPIEQVARTDADGMIITEPGCPKMEELKDFVRSGGGLVLFTGEKVDTSFWNRYFYANNTGLAPVALGEVLQAGRAGTVYENVLCFRLDPTSIEVDPALAVFQGDGRAFCDLIQFQAFHRSVDSPQPPGPDVKATRVLARFNDHVGTGSDVGSPAIVSRQFGQGSVLCFLTAGTSRPQPRGLEWTNWPKETLGTFNLVMLDMLSAYGRPMPKLTDLVGRDFEYALPGGILQATATIVPPGNTGDLLTVSTGGEADAPESSRGRLICRDTRWAGVYEMDVTLGATKVKTFFSRVVDHVEGDLRAAGRSGIESGFGGKEFAYIAKSQGSAGDVAAGTGKEYWVWAMAAALLLLAAEVFLGQRFGHYSK